MKLIQKCRAAFLGNMFFSVRVKSKFIKSGNFNEYKKRLRVFTDCTKLESREAGVGVFLEMPIFGKHPVRQRLGPHPTVFQAEALAITKACEAV